MALNDDPEKDMGRPRILRTDGNFAIIEGFIREDRRVKSSWTTLQKQLCSVSHPLETNIIMKECLNL
jgi:hypothetical protein